MKKFQFFSDTNLRAVDQYLTARDIVHQVDWVKATITYHTGESDSANDYVYEMGGREI